MRHHDTLGTGGYEGPRVPTPPLKARNAPARLYRGLATASKKPRDERQPSAPGNEERGLPWYKQSGAFQRRAAVNHQLRSRRRFPVAQAGQKRDPGLETTENLANVG
jgi:hypothetical protein